MRHINERLLSSWEFWESNLFFLSYRIIHPRNYHASSFIYNTVNPYLLLLDKILQDIRSFIISLNQHKQGLQNEKNFGHSTLMSTKIYLQKFNQRSLFAKAGRLAGTAFNFLLKVNFYKTWRRVITFWLVICSYWFRYNTQEFRSLLKLRKLWI